MAVACSGEHFSSPDTSGSGAGGVTGGTGGKGGSSGGSGGSAGKGGSGGSGGSGGTSATGGSSGSATGGSGGGTDARADCRSSGCPATDYCNTETLVCTACADLARLEFSAPERVMAVSGTTEGNQRFPRLTHNANEMLFQTGAYNTAKQLWVTANYTDPTQHQLLTGVAGTNQALNGPLEASVTLAGATLNFFFDRTVGISSARELLGGVRSGASVTGVTRLPIPFNDPAVSALTSNYGIAVAPGVNRMWWMTTRLTTAGELVTATPTNTTASVVTLVTESECARRGSDATPWVSKDGSLLLFRSIEQGETCVTGLDVNDLYAVTLNSSGLPVAGARKLSVSTAGWDDTDPAMSSDLCWLYFSSDEGPPDSEFDVFRAQRN